MDKTLKIALILTAVDKMSSVISSATNQSVKRMQDLQMKSSAYLKEGMVYGGASAAGFAFLHKTSEAFGDLQESSLKMKAAMLQDGGILDETTFNKLDVFTNKISAQLTGSAADYKDMVSVMMENGLKAQDILGGTGEAVGKLAVLFNMAPSSIGQFAARMKQDMGIANNEMEQMTDMVARLKNAGVGKTGEEAVMEMQEAFSKAGLGASNLGIKGVEAAKSLGSLMGIFIRRGISGSTVGNNFRRIFDGLRDIDKLKKSNEVAKQFGVTLDFYDKKGNFKGIDNFIGQIGKLEGLGTQKTAAILKPFGGKQGLSTDFLEFLGKEGTKGFNEMQAKLSSQATLQQKVQVTLSGQKKQAQIASTSWKNAMGEIGKNLEPVNEGFSTMSNKIAVFITEHPRLAKFVSVFVALGSAALGIWAIVKAFQAVRAIMTILNITMAANPFILIVMAAIIVVALVITYWDKIKPFFIKLWAGIKSIFSKVWDWIKNMFLNYTPMGLVMKHWDKISAFFINLWEGVKKTFFAVVDWVMDLGTKFYNAGKNIINNIIDGIKSGINKVTEVMGNITKKIRAFLPFSPAKEGALRDIHRIKLVETIAQSIRVKPVVDAMHRVSNAVFNTGPASISSRLSPVSSGGGITLNYAPVIHGASDDVMKQLKTHDRELLRLVNEAQRKQGRTLF